MEERHKVLLRARRLEIASDLRFKDIRRRLLDSGILNGENLDEIENQQTRGDQVNALLDILPTRGPNAFTVFRDALKPRYPHLARILNDEGQQGPQREPRVFIIHAGEDKESFVRPLVTTLQRQGLAEKDIFFDDVSIKPGEVVRDRIISTLSSESLELAVVVVSTSFLNKPYWPKLEYETCLKNNKRIFPIWVDANDDKFKAFSELVGKYSPTLKQMSARRVQRDDVTDELTNIAAEVVQRLSTLGSSAPQPAAIQTLLYLTPSPSPSDSGSSDEETRMKDEDTLTTSISDEQGVEDRLKDEKARQLDLLAKLGGIQLDLLKKAEGLLSREETEKQTKEVLSQLLRSGLDIVKIKMGCAILHLLPNNLLSLDTMWTMYRSGQLGVAFTDCLITDEMRAITGQDLAVRVIMLEEQYWQWAEYFNARDMEQTVQELESLTMTLDASLRRPSTSATSWETFVDQYLPGDTEQVKLLLDSAWRDPVVELVVLIPFFWPHIVTYWLERNHTFPQTLTELIQYSLCKHFARQTGSVSEQECASLSETITESLIQLGSKGLGSIVQSNSREIDVTPEETKGFDSAVFDLLKLSETKRYTFVNTFLHDFCVALYIKDTLDKSTNTAVLQQLVQNAGRMPLVCFFTSGLLGDRAGDFLSALAKGGVFNSPFEKVETCLIALSETHNVPSLYSCIESVFNRGVLDVVFNRGVLDVSSESVLTLLFSSAAIRFINQSRVVQSVRLCDRSKLKKGESEILRKLEANPEEESVWLSSHLWSDVSDRRFILLLLQCIPLLSAVKKAGSKSKEPIMFKTPLSITAYMYSPGTINSTQMLQLTQAMKHMISLTRLDLKCNYVEDDLVDHVSPSTKYCSTCKLTASATTTFMSSYVHKKLQKLAFYVKMSDDETKALAVSLQHADCLEEFQLWNCGISDIGCTAIAEVFVYMRSLKRLDLSLNQISVSGAKSFAAHVGNLICLEDLDLSDNKLSDDGCIVIAEAFHKMKSVNYLFLSSNEISDRGGTVLMEKISFLTNLYRIRLRRNMMTDAVAQLVVDAVKGMGRRIDVDLSSNCFSSKGVKILKQHDIWPDDEPSSLSKSSSSSGEESRYEMSGVRGEFHPKVFSAEYTKAEADIAKKGQGLESEVQKAPKKSTLCNVM